MKPWFNKLLLFSTLAGAAALIGGCVAGGYADGGGGAVVVDADYYGPGYGGPVFYGHPGYRGDSHIASPPHQNWHGGGSAPAGHSAPAARSGSGGNRR